MLKNLLIGNILNAISIYMAFVIALIVFYDSNTLLLFKKALISMVWFSPIVLIMLMVLGLYDFNFCRQKNIKWLLKETVIVISIAFIFFLFEENKQESFSGGVLIATSMILIVFVLIQYIKFLIFRSCPLTMNKDVDT